jgi:hypothetical protein
MRLFVVMAAIVLSAGGAPLPVAAQPYQVHGPGAKSCGAWTEYRRTSVPLAGVMEAWVEGYISALNAISAINGHGPDMARGDIDGAIGWLDNYCASHPLDQLSTATMALVQELDRR